MPSPHSPDHTKTKGTRKFTLEGHTRSIFALRWNRRGDLLLSCSVDCAAIVWDARSGALRSRCVHHAAPLLDGDWRTNAIYATASADRTIAVFRVGEDRPLKVWKVGAGAPSWVWGMKGGGR